MALSVGWNAPPYLLVVKGGSRQVPEARGHFSLPFNFSYIRCKGGSSRTVCIPPASLFSSTLLLQGELNPKPSCCRAN